MLSVSARLLIAASVVLMAFLGLTGLTLDQAFRESALTAMRSRLQAQVYMLLGVAEFDPGEGLLLPDALPEARLSSPGSGLYARVTDADGIIIWRSRSTLGLALPPFPVVQSPGEFHFQAVQGQADSPPLFTLSFTVSWEVLPDTYRRYAFQVAETRQSFAAEVGGFRRSLWGWLLGVAVVLLLAQGVILRWSLKPLRRVAREVMEIEAGQRAELAGPYPKELRALTSNLNALIQHSQAHLERYRNALGDLAHSLKTPLAVLRGVVEKESLPSELSNTVQEQVERMNRTVDYQLQRAAASGRIALAAPVPVAPIARKVMDALAKVYADRSLRFQRHVDEQLVFYGDEGDLLEILGNLTDNACKWARSRVDIRAYPFAAASRRAGLVVEVEDDGPGIPSAKRQLILKRGERADPSVAGHGIGLAVVRDIVEEVYQGTLEIADGTLGGACIRVRLRF